MECNGVPKLRTARAKCRGECCGYFVIFFRHSFEFFLGLDLTQRHFVCKELKFTVSFFTRTTAGNIEMHRFACHLEKGCAPFCVPFELMRIVLRADLNIVHRFACRVKMVCIILRATLKGDLHRFACRLR